MEVDISAMMVVAALRMVDVVGEAGSPRQMSWYLEDNVIMMTSVLVPGRHIQDHLDGDDG